MPNGGVQEQPELWPERRYMWGTSEAFNEKHSDLIVLRRLLLQEGVEEISDSKHERCGPCRYIVAATTLAVYVQCVYSGQCMYSVCMFIQQKLLSVRFVLIASRCYNIPCWYLQWFSTSGVVCSEMFEYCVNDTMADRSVRFFAVKERGRYHR
jgi:hypothetical protein